MSRPATVSLLPESTAPPAPCRHAQRRRLLAAWAAIGASAQICLPALHQASTALGPLALWLWLLPLTALTLDRLLAPARVRREARAAYALQVAGRAAMATRKHRLPMASATQEIRQAPELATVNAWSGPALRLGRRWLSRRARPLPARRRAPPGRRAGSG